MKPGLFMATGALCALLTACDRQAGAPVGDMAALAEGAEGFAQAQPGGVLSFPRDHGAHPTYRIEWWYLTANLEDERGRPYGAQWTLFRSAQRPVTDAEPTANPWQDPQVWMAHFAITTPEEHFSFQRYARGGEHGGLARAGARAAPFRAWLDDWRMESGGTAAQDWLPLRLQARQDDFAIDLELASDRPLVRQGQAGFSQKHPEGGGSWYYSHPFLEASGELTVDGRPVRVTGQAWLDREWSSQFLQADQSGWDWFALHLDSGEKLMLFQLRTKAPADSGPSFRHGVLIGPDGSKRELDPERLRFEPLERARVAGRVLPVRWRIALPELDRELQVSALHTDQWMTVDFGYWEGVVTVAGDDPGWSGRGYLEMTGYPAR